MYPKLSLYNNYLEYSRKGNPLPDVTARTTMYWINCAINVCDTWDNFMDIGGGDGKNAVTLLGKFKKGTLVEVDNSDEHEKIKGLYENISIFNDLIEKYPSNYNKADFILLADVYEHIPEIEKFVKQISDLQTDTGVVYIMTPNPIFCGPATESEIYHTKKQYGHIKHYTAQEIVSQMKKYNYELILHKYEESNLRRKLKLVVKALARRDLRWRSNILYRLSRPIILPFFRLISKIIDKIVFKNEMGNSNNPFTTITQNLIFKKIK
jgi:SAM-dependent methyltransferase